jgi:uncharacterized protein
MDTTTKVEIVNNKEMSRFEMKLGSDIAYVDYGWRNDVFELLFIFVPVQYRGKGIAEDLIKYVLNHAVANNLSIDIYCSWIAAFVRNHSEYHFLLNKNR